MQKLQPRCLVRSVLMLGRALSSAAVAFGFYMVTLIINNRWVRL